MTAAIAFAVLVQIAQIYLPARSPGAWDIVANVLGLLAGCLLALAVRPRIATAVTDWRLPLPALICVMSLLAYQLAPYAPSLDVGMLRASIRAFVFAPWDWASYLRAGLYVVAIHSVLLATGARYSLAVTVCLAVLILFLKPMIPGADASIAGHLGLVTGLLICLIPNAGRYYRTTALALLALYFWDGLTPWQWRPELIAPDLTVVGTIVRGSWSANIIALLWKAYLFTAMLVLFSRQSGAEKHESLGTWAIVILVACTLGVELTQSFIASGTPSLTDPVMAVTLAVALRHWKSDDVKRSDT